MALLKPFGNLLSPKRTVPTGKLSIDWTHPLANGLLACYVPGVMAGINIASPGAPDLSPLSNASIGSGVEGPALVSTAANSGYSATAPSSFKGGSQYSLYWRGVWLGTPSANCGWLGITANNTDSSPYIIVQIGDYDGSGKFFCSFAQSSGNVWLHPAVSQPVANNTYSIGCTFVGNSGPVVLYNGGVSVGSTTSGTGNFNAGTATSTVDLNTYSGNTSRNTNASCFIGCIWNRALTADEMAWLDKEPYCFLLPAEGEMPALKSGATATPTGPISKGPISSATIGSGLSTFPPAGIPQNNGGFLCPPSALLKHPVTLDTNQLLGRTNIIAPTVGSAQLAQGPLFDGPLGVGALGTSDLGDAAAAATTPADCSFLFQASANLRHPATVDTNQQPRDNMRAAWDNPSPSQLGFWFQPPFLGPVPKSTQNTNQPFYISPAEPKTPTALWLEPTPDLQRHVPTIYTAQSFVCNPTIGPPVLGTAWFTQAPALLKHPCSLDTNQPFNFAYAASSAPTQVFKTTTGAGSWTVPANVYSITVEGIGGGATGSSAGGGGGGYAKSIVSVSPGQTLYYTVGATSTDTWANISANSAPGSSSSGIIARGASSQTGGGAGASSIGSLTYNGGNGGNSGNNGAGGGGGSGGPSGAGAQGGNGGADVNYSGGGGGADGGSAGNNATGGGDGAGGNGSGGTGGGSAGGGNATSGTGGGGGGNIAGSAGSGASDNCFDATHGAGGGGGGSYAFVGGSSNGYGGGGGGSSLGSPGTGAQGILVITYTTGGAPSNPTPADCSFLFQPSALLNHPQTLDTNQQKDNFFAGQANVTPTAFGFWQQAPDLLRHAATLDTNQPVDQGWTQNLTPAPLAFWRQPAELLRHPATLDTNQPLDAEFAGLPGATPTSFGFFTQAPVLLRHAATVDTNQPLDDVFAGWANVTPSALGFWRQADDLLHHPANVNTQQSFEYLPPTPGATPADCSFLFQPVALLNHPVTLDTNEPLDDAFFGWAQNLTPTALGFWTQAPDLFKHPASIDTRQPFEYLPPPGVLTPADCSFLFQPSALLNHAPTLDTNQGLGDTFNGWAQNLTPTSFGFWTQAVDLVRHPTTVDTNQPRLSNQTASTPSSLGFWTQAPDLLRHPATVDTNQPCVNFVAGWSVPTPTQLGFFTQAPDLFKHPVPLDTNQPKDNLFAGWANATPTSFGFFAQAPDLLRHAITVDTNQSFVFNPPAAAVTPSSLWWFQPLDLLRHPSTIDTNQPRLVGQAGATPSQCGFWRQPPDLLRHPPHLDTNQPRLRSQIGATPTQFGFYTQPLDLLRHPVPFVLGMQPFEVLPAKPTSNAITRVYFFS